MKHGSRLLLTEWKKTLVISKTMQSLLALCFHVRSEYKALAFSSMMRYPLSLFHGVPVHPISRIFSEKFHRKAIWCASKQRIWWKKREWKISGSKLRRSTNYSLSAWKCCYYFSHLGKAGGKHTHQVVDFEVRILWQLLCIIASFQADLLLKT